MMINEKTANQIDRFDIFYLFLLTLSIALLYTPFITTGEFWWTDESRHAMDGVFILDFMKELPFESPYQYAVEYFTQYPALGFSIYPPFFAFVESLVFAALGISEQSARLTVLIFLFIGAIPLYLMLRDSIGKLTAFLCTIIIITSPIYTLWTGSVMLEAPAVTMMLLSAFLFQCYLRKQTLTAALLLGLSVSAMLFTKQTTFFILPAFFIYATLTQELRFFFDKKLLITYGLVALTFLALLLHALKFGSVALDIVAGSHGDILGVSRFSFERWAQTLRVVWNAHSGPLLVLSGIGLLSSIGKCYRKADLFIHLWILSWFIFVSMVVAFYNDALRYTMYLTPMLAALAARPLLEVKESQKYRKGALILSMIITIFWNLSTIMTRPVPHLQGYKEAAQNINTLQDDRIILFCCKHDGNFVFHMRQLDSSRKKIILRADKTLVSMSISKLNGVIENANNDEEILRLIDRYGISLLVLESRDVVGLPQFQRLIELAKTDRFELIKNIPVTTNLPQYQDIDIRIYRYLDAKPPENDEIVIPMPHNGQELRLRL